MKRVIIIVLDSVGIGELPDAGDYGDSGSNTLLNIKRKVPGMNLENLSLLGLSHIDGADLLKNMHEEGSKLETDNNSKAINDLKPKAAYCKLAEASKGKDTTIGHWEIAGVVTENPFPTYPNGFPEELLRRFEKEIGRKTIGNTTASGTEIISRLGDEHVKTGFPIVYTSADSVFQIAMHEEVIPLDEQYRISRIAREMTDVSRVITRPFIGKSGNYTRTANRHDFSVVPPVPTMLDYIAGAGLSVTAIGKINDIFAGRGITKTLHTKSNSEGIDTTLKILKECNEGLIFTNLVDFDMLYGHRNDFEGYADALMQFDQRVPEILSALKPEDMLFINADHGCDPTTASTDHSREYVPLIIYGAHVKPGTNLHIRNSFSDIGATVMEYLNVQGEISGESFLNHVLR